MNCSIIIPTKNRAQLLRRCISSVPNNYEIIIVDDGSEINEFKSIKTLSNAKVNSIRLYQNPFVGAASARNFGAARAHAEWLCFLDDDDLIMPGFFEKMEDLISSNPSILAWLPDIKNCVKHTFRAVTINELQITNRAGGCSGFLVRKSYFNAIGGYDPKLPALQDWDLWIRIAKDSKLFYSGILGVNYSTNSSKKITYNLVIKYRGFRILYFKHINEWTARTRQFHLVRNWALRQLIRKDKCGFVKCLSKIAIWPLALIYYLKWWQHR